MAKELNDAIAYVAGLLAGAYRVDKASKDAAFYEPPMAAQLVMPIREAQIEVQRRLRIIGSPQVKITVSGTYTALAATVDHESGTVRPVEMWEKGTTEDATHFRRMLESHETQLDLLPPVEHLTLWRWDGGVVKVRPATQDRSYRQRGYMVSGGAALPWEVMLLGAGSEVDDVWFPVFHLAAATWLTSRSQLVDAREHVGIAERLLGQIAQEHSRLKQSRPVRRRPYYRR